MSEENLEELIVNTFLELREDSLFNFSESISNFDTIEKIQSYIFNKIEENRTLKRNITLDNRVGINILLNFMNSFNKTNQIDTKSILESFTKIKRYLKNRERKLNKFIKKINEYIHNAMNEICDDCPYKISMNVLDTMQKKDHYNIDTKDVYFIRSELKLIKIGIALDPEKRLQSLRQDSHYDLELLATIKKGGHSKEKELHNRFYKYRAFGEWFKESKEILEYIESIK